MSYHTIQDFPDFYNNEFIKSISHNKKWTVSDKNKRPIDMTALITKNKIWGAAYDRGYNPLVDLKTLTGFLPDATNNAYNLNAYEDGYVVLDIEPICPPEIKADLLKLPYIYGEKSMSGKGFHLVFPLPKEICNKYPVIQNKTKLQRQDRYYEILLIHMITFTRNTIPFPDASLIKDIDAFNKIFEDLAKTAKSSAPVKHFIVSDIKTDDIPMYDKTIAVLSSQIYDKKPINFYNDMSRYEFGMASFYYHKLKRLQQHYSYASAGIRYSDEQTATIIYKLLSSKLEPREKHATLRHDMPYLLYIATSLIAANKNQTKESKSDESISEKSEENNSSD